MKHNLIQNAALQALLVDMGEELADLLLVDVTGTGERTTLSCNDIVHLTTDPDVWNSPVSGEGHHCRNAFGQVGRFIQQVGSLVKSFGH